jgi:hypothetical protein
MDPLERAPASMNRWWIKGIYADDESMLIRAHPSHPRFMVSMHARERMGTCQARRNWTRCRRVHSRSIAGEIVGC